MRFSRIWESSMIVEKHLPVSSIIDNTTQKVAVCITNSAILVEFQVRICWFKSKHRNMNRFNTFKHCQHIFLPLERSRKMMKSDKWTNAVIFRNLISHLIIGHQVTDARVTRKRTMQCRHYCDIITIILFRGFQFKTYLILFQTRSLHMLMFNPVRQVHTDDTHSHLETFLIFVA